MAELPQYPTDEQIKAALDAHSKGKQALGEYLRAAEAKMAAEKMEAEKNSPKA